ncbi:MAG: methyltransferase [Vicingaceae bacterium]|nr:methyltransferase [Vicingaceae bacterium]
MKVGTDGVLLGAWSTIKGNNVLDIGTGTGVIAIMLAQRNTSIIIDAVEIEIEAFKEAEINSNNCTWKNRISIYNNAIQYFQLQKKYDTIISNPPFFIDSTKAPKSDRNSARHTDELSFQDLITNVIRLLNSEGIFSLILPITEAEQFTELAKEEKLFLNRKCVIKPNPTKPSKRVLMEFSLQPKELIETELTIETVTRHQYTKEYISLTKDFYLKF